ncbi:Disease resistance protein [Cynara cardunculus var. scolymus]|uniref:Disease resistance protein n=1 Tax=Cynara cardunculus var. scolymus TaxID=59895 RepID=A0A103XDF4_CYNCS|nr:Disease resistance protein [Cynara cardunculus var. scolymus]
MEIVTAIVSPLVESLMVPVKKHLGYLISYKKYVRDMGTRMRDLKATRLGVEDHINHNKSNCLMVPMEVSGWLEEVGNIEAQSIFMNHAAAMHYLINTPKSPLVESLMVPVKKHLGYLISYKKYVRDMGTKMRELKATRLGVEDHINHNKSNSLKVPMEVSGWLEEVGNIEEQVLETIPSDVGSCFNLKDRHKLGRKAFKITQDIDRLKEEKSRIDWTDHPIPLAKVDSMKLSTSTPSSYHNDFKSREPTFMEALKALQPDNKTHMIALCGMGGVGKTIMVQKLKKVVSEKKLFDFIIEISEVDDDIHNVAFPSYLMHNLHQLHTLKLDSFEGVEVVFKIESSSCRKLATTQNNQQPELLPHLKNLKLIGLKRMIHVWKYDWNQFLVSQQEPKSSSFVNITSITLSSCGRVKYLFSPLMAKLLSNLISIRIKSCDAMEEVVSNIDDEYEGMATSISCHTNTTFFPHLDNLNLGYLPCLKRINGVGNKCGGKKLMTCIVSASSVYDKFQCYQVGGAYWSSCQYAKKIDIRECDALLTLIPSQAVGHMPKLEVLKITSCESMREIFETEGVNEDVGDNANIGEGSGDTGAIPTPINMTSLELPNLKTLYIVGCHSLKYIFPTSVLESLKKLQKLKISYCSAIQVIVKQEVNGEHIIGLEDVVFPRLTTLKLVGLPNLKGFFLGKNDFQWPLLDKVEIYGCPQMMIFTSGRSMASKLEYIHTGVGKHSLECGLNFDWTNAPHEGQLYRSSSCLTAADIVELLQFPWSFSNLVEVDVGVFDVASSKAIFPSNELFNVENVGDIEEAEKVFEVVEGTNDETQSADDVILISKKKQVIWKSNWWIPSKLSNLTRVSLVYCQKLEHVFSHGMAASLVQLQHLNIDSCLNLKVIVEAVRDSTNEVVSFPCLKFLQLSLLYELEGFCLGNDQAFQWPSLDTLIINRCPRMTVFTKGQSTTPKLEVIRTNFGWCEAKDDINSFIRKRTQEVLAQVRISRNGDCCRHC